MGVAGLSACHGLPAGFHDYVVFDGLVLPTGVELSPDGRIFVAEKRGIIKVFDGITDPTPTVVADLRTNVYNSWDRGLLGLALHPSFPGTRDLFVSYTYDAEPGGTAPRWGQPGVDDDVCPTPPGATQDGCVVGARVSRLRLSRDGTSVTGPERVLVEDWCQQYPSHSIGTIAFGADGALYAGGGDGASWDWADYGQRGIPTNPCGDPGAGPDGSMSPPGAEGGALRAQDLRTNSDPTGLDGTIIRIDPTTGAALPSNPLAAAPDPNARRIVAYGMRNPFRFTVRPGTNELWIGDVGWSTWEEINVSQGDDPVVDNFGWPCLEGPDRALAYDDLDLTMCEDLYDDGSATAPFFAYGHKAPIADDGCPTSRGSSLAGLAFAPADSAYPDAYDRALFFADLPRACIFVMPAGSDGRPDPGRITVFHEKATPAELQFGPGGELWYVDIYAGAIRRIGYSATNTPPQAAFSAHPTSGDPPLAVSFDAGASADSDAGDSLTYAWDLDGDGALDDGTAPTATATYETVGAHTVRLAVTDAAGATDTATMTIWVGTEPPVPTITEPAEGSVAAVGESVSFSGSARASSGELPPSALSWRADLMHCTTVDQCHRHPGIFGVDGAASGSFTMPDHEYPAHVELRLTATWNGGSVTATRRIDYRTVDVTVSADIPDVALTLGSVTGVAPLTRPLGEGSTVTVSAPASVANDFGSFTFVSWSDGGARVHEIVVPASGATLTAHYVPAG